MRVFLVASVVMLMLFVAVAVCIAGSPVETCSGIELQLEEATSDRGHAEALACARCLDSYEHNYNRECTEEAENIANASTARTVLKLPRVAVLQMERIARSAARSGVEVGAVGALAFDVQSSEI